MDGLSIVGLAANVMQFVEFGARLLSEVSDIYQSASGLTREHEELQEVAKDLTRVIDRLVVPPQNPAHDEDNLVPSVEREISRIALLAKAVAENLMAVTQELAETNGANKKWRSFRQALASLWKKEKIEALQKRLENLRSQLATHILGHVSVLQSSLISDFAKLQIHCEELIAVRKDDIKQILDSLQDLKAHVANMGSESLKKADTILSEAKKGLEIYDKERQILQSLQFETMEHRYHAITYAHHRTFNWIFEPPNPRLSGQRSINFKNWLVHGHGVYWVSGKPGSGKSTLMKYICDTSTTMQYLQHWAQDDKLVIAAFYFWSAGTEMQRSQRGLLQQLLFEILRACPDFIPLLSGQRWHDRLMGDWSVRELQAAFGKLQDTTCRAKICFFIDGLDEYDGDELELIQVLKSISKAQHIKLCVASRPWPCFEDAFGSNADLKLYLHHHTIDDISRFAQDKLEEIPGFAVLSEECQSYSELVTEITHRAHGVFLWVFLVVRSVREGLTNGDSLHLLRRRLDIIPSDLEPFFDQLIGSVDKIYREQMAITLEVALRAPEPMCMLTYWFLDEQNTPVKHGPSGPDFAEIRAIEGRMRRRLEGCYKGLLEGIGPPGSRKVHFIHRTVRDYLRTRNIYQLFGQPVLHASSKAYKALVSHSRYCDGQNRRGFNSQDFEYFLVFARQAEMESDDFNWEYVQEMDKFVSPWFANDRLRFLCEAVRFGFTAYLKLRHQEDPTLFQRLSRPLLHAALGTQLSKVHEIFGIQSSYDTLNLLLNNGADPNFRVGNTTIFLDFLSENGVHARRSNRPWAYEQWEESLSILLRHGASFNDVFADVRLIEALPQIGFTKDGGIHDLAAAVLRTDGSLREGLHQHLNIYEVFFRHGLDPNLGISWFTLWELWLWYISEWQNDHGCLEDICVRAMKLFLSNGAEPYKTVRFKSDRVGGSSKWDVTEIVHSFFTQDSQAILIPILDAAKRRRQVGGALSPLTDCRKRPREDDRIGSEYMRNAPYEAFAPPRPRTHRFI